MVLFYAKLFKETMPDQLEKYGEIIERKNI